MITKTAPTQADVDRLSEELGASQWWDVPGLYRENMYRLVTFMLEGCWEDSEVGRAISKPWSYSTVLAAAQLELDPLTWEEDLTLHTV